MGFRQRPPHRTRWRSSPHWGPPCLSAPHAGSYLAAHRPDKGAPQSDGEAPTSLRPHCRRAIAVVFTARGHWKAEGVLLGALWAYPSKNHLDFWGPTAEWQDPHIPPPWQPVVAAPASHNGYTNLRRLNQSPDQSHGPMHAFISPQPHRGSPHCGGRRTTPQATLS
uniref:Uncharacterized protein n=1 Tax=Arundo donax TaxID=35708 RepID=A0A0A9AMD7_ARUDO